MSAQAAAPELAVAVAPEDRARADFYALVARLFYAGPDTGLLAAIAGADEIAAAGIDASLARAWSALIAAAAAMEAEAACAEYDSVFVGTGKAEITPYASHYLTQVMRESVLVRLRAELAAMGLGRDPGAAEFEDHLSGLCEVMRHLILLGSGDAAVRKQKSFFLEYVSLSYADFCAAVTASPNTNFYKHVARFAKAFLDVEAKSFEMV